MINELIDKGKELITGGLKRVGLMQYTDEETLLSKYEGMFQDSAQSKVAYERQWFINLAAVAGYQWLQWDTVGLRFIQAPTPTSRVRLTINKILPIYRRKLAMINDYDPRAFVTPKSHDSMDEEAASLGTQLCSGLTIITKMSQVDHEINMWRLITGNAYKHYRWNPKKGRKIEQARTGRLEQTEGLPEGPELPQTQTQEELYEGDVDALAVNPYEIYPVGNPTSDENLIGLIWVRFVPISEIKDVYGVDVPEEQDNTIAGMYRDRLETMVTSLGIGSGGGSPSRAKKHALLKIIYLKPTPDKPKGEYGVWANKKLLFQGDIPDIDLGEEFEIPFRHYKDLMIPGRYWGQSTIEQLAQLNREYNRSVSMLIENRNWNGFVRYVYEKDSLVSPITNDPNSHIVVKKGTTLLPTQQKPHELPQYQIQLPLLLNQAIMDVGGVQEVSQAQTPTSVTSGIAIQSLQAQDEAQASTVFVESATNKQVTFTALVKLCQAHYTEERIIQYTGEDNKIKTMNFKGSLLRGNTGVIIETNDIMPLTRKGRQQFIMQLDQGGWLGDPTNEATRQAVLRALETGNMQALYDRNNADITQAKFENTMLSKGQLVLVEDWHNHQVHIVEHTNFMKSPKFYELPPEVQNMFRQHLYQHTSWLQGIIQDQTNQQAEQMSEMPEEEQPVESGAKREE